MIDPLDVYPRTSDLAQSAQVDAFARPTGRRHDVLAGEIHERTLATEQPGRDEISFALGSVPVLRVSRPPT